MNKQERIAAYEENIKTINVKSFNWYAFVFSWLYFLYTGYSFLYFFLCLFIPLILMIIAVNTSFLVPVFFIGVLTAHTLAGFVANRRKKHYMEQYILRERFLSENSLSDNIAVTAAINRKADRYDEYMNIPPLRLAVYTFISCGLFTIYWAYHNWMVYRNKSDEDISPLVRAIFNHLTIYELVKRMQVTVKNNEHTCKLCAVLYIICSILMGIFYQKARQYGASPEAGIMAMANNLMFLACSLLLIPIQNSVVSTLPKKEYESSGWGIFWLTLGTLINLYSLLR